MKTRVVCFFFDKDEYKEEIRKFREEATELSQRNNLRIGISSGSDINSISVSGMANNNNKRKKKQGGGGAKRRERECRHIHTHTHTHTASSAL